MLKQADVDHTLPAKDSLLARADALINGQRQADYGPPGECFRRIAGLWTAYLNHEVTSGDVAMLMVLLKVARWQQRGQEDAVVDAAGYLGCIELIHEP